jgi:hypothetical protein
VIDRLKSYLHFDIGMESIRTQFSKDDMAGFDSSVSGVWMLTYDWTLG